MVFGAINDGAMFGASFNYKFCAQMNHEVISNPQCEVGINPKQPTYT
jgi:hypothetical protein